jgi:hypothetical protein
MIHLRTAIFITVVGTGAFASGCSRSAATSEPAQANPAAGPAHSAVSSRPAQNACALVAREELEAIAGEKLELLHNIEDETETVCELKSATSKMTLIFVKVHWQGGKELARIDQAATGMAKQVVKNEENADIEALTGSGKMRGLADKAYYSNLMPSWFVKGDVMVEVISPTFGRDKTKAVFLSVAKSALSRL